ncbi:MAG: alpha/beta hydrolase [Microvirga sp.]
MNHLKLGDSVAQAAHDAQFKLDSIFELEAVMERRTKAAEVGLAAFEVRQYIPYGARREETLNLFPARRAQGLAPAHVFIHGGFWRSMRADQFSFLARGFVPFGVSLAIIDYPLIPDVRLGDIVTSCKTAISWIYRNGSDYGLDPDCIFISGNSAGGHLVAELLDRTWVEQAGLPHDVIKGGAAISGLYDLEPVRTSFQNDVLQLTADEVEAFSPLRRELAIEAPIIAAVGGDETEEFLRQTADFAAILERSGVDVKHLVVPHTNHITVVLDALADPSERLNCVVRQQMGALDAQASALWN